MITKHRSRRSTTKPAAASVGAPFLGAFVVTVQNFDPGAGTAVVRALGINNDGTTYPADVWTPTREVPLGAVRVFDLGIEIEPTAIEIDGTGYDVNVTFPPIPTTGAVWVPAGHPGLIAKNGAQCGGCYAEG